MKPLYRILITLSLLLPLLLASQPALAQSPDGTDSVVNLPSLKAVVIVGPIDDDTGPWTLSEINHMEQAAQALESHGVFVSRFYTPNNSWDDIKKAAWGAHFFLYSGHGVAWPAPMNVVGGLALKDLIVSPDQIRTELHLARNALVMLYGCWTTGTAGGETATSSDLAQTRVAQYSSPFFAAGAGGYYADWNSLTFARWIDLIFAGSTLGDGFMETGSFDPSGWEDYAYPTNTNLDLWLDHDPNPNGVLYDYAFAGRSTAALLDLFGVSNVNLQPTLYLPLLMN